MRICTQIAKENVFESEVAECLNGKLKSMCDFQLEWSHVCHWGPWSSLLCL